MSEVRILSVYKDYTPPVDLEKVIRALLQVVPADLLVGLAEITLTNSSSPARSHRRRRVWTQRRKSSVSRTRGLYHARSREGEARIEIFVDKVFKGFPRAVLLLGLIRSLLLADVLYHELGHHIGARIQPQRGVEHVACEWSRRLTASFISKRYWYAMPLIRVMAILGRSVKRSHERSRPLGG